MQIYPAIDLRQNQCVRLYKGQFDQITTYANHPIEVAKNYESTGADWLHLVDLDGAEQNGHNHLLLAEQIKEQTALHIQFGGGIRETSQINHLLKAGIDRIVIGSLAVKNPNLVKTWLAEFGKEKIVLALDIQFQNNLPMTATHGWKEASHLSLWDLLIEYENVELQHILCTDISRDGTLQGPNFSLYQEWHKRFPQYSVQASGGVSELNDLIKLKELQTSGVIIGKALYEKKFTLREALRC